MAVSVLWLFLSVSWFGMQCGNVIIPVHTHFLQPKTICGLQCSHSDSATVYVPFGIAPIV